MLRGTEKITDITKAKEAALPKQKYLNKPLNKQIQQFIFDGYFLGLRTTGCERYATEILKEFDKTLCEKCENTGKFILYTCIEPPFTIENIRIVKSRFSKKLPFIIELSLYALFHRAVIINIIHQVYPVQWRVIAAVHDVREKVTNFKYYSQSIFKRMKVALRLSILTKCSKHIITVSNTEKNNIVKYYGIAPKKITVIHSAWNHVLTINKDERIFDRYSFLQEKKYCLSTSTLGRNKNFEWIVKVAKINPDYDFVITGRIDTSSFFGEKFSDGGLPNVHHLGYVTDEELAALMGNCCAFLFPSLYEGFGLPPLEALGLGAGTAVVSNVTCLPEIYDGDPPSVHFIDPYDYYVDISKLVSEPVAPREILLEKYSWSKSANKLYGLLISIASHSCERQKGYTN
jgi:glycosyltransferase involved in cell wall biosynthesis